MKKNRYLCLVLCLAMVFTLQYPASASEAAGTTVPAVTDAPAEPTAPSAPLVSTDPDVDASIVNGCHSFDAQVPLRSDPVLTTAKSSFLYELESDTLVYGTNMDLKFSPGSFVKLMTAALALEMGDPAQEITITAEMLEAVPEGSSITGVSGLMEGERLTMEDLLYCLIVDSANDAAVALAVSVSGSEEAFVEKMNAKAAELGCTNTHFTNVHGIYHENQYTTARDLARIMAYGIQDTLFQEIIDTDFFWLDSNDVREEGEGMYSDNYMLGQLILEIYADDRCTGGKVSTNEQGQRSLAITAESNNLRYVGIVINADPKYDGDGWEIKEYMEYVEMDRLLNLGFENYQPMQILFDGQILDSFSVTNGTNAVAVGPTNSVRSLLPATADLSSLSMRYLRTNGVLTAPVEKGTLVDVLQIWYGSVCIAQSDLVTMNSSRVAEASSNTQDDGGFSMEGFGKVLGIVGIIAGVGLSVFLILFLIRWVRVTRLRSRRRKRRNSRRRSR